MSDGYRYNAHNDPLRDLRDDEIELLCAALSAYETLMTTDPHGAPRSLRDARLSLFTKARDAAVQRDLASFTD